MKKYLFTFLLFAFTLFCYSQNNSVVRGKIVNAANDDPMENVNIVNLNQVYGTSTDIEGKFEIIAKANDTLHLSFLGFKSIKVRVTNDWINFGNTTTIELTELALALEEVVVNKLKLTGYLEVDIKQVPIQKIYAIAFLDSILDMSLVHDLQVWLPKFWVRYSILRISCITFLEKTTRNEKTSKNEKQEEIRTILSSRFDREMLTALLQVDKIDLDLLISECNYSDDFIRTANDLQILDAISECYEEYKILSKGR